MRISPSEALSIRQAIQARDPSAIVNLFGSMADDNARGGDIDLLIRSKNLTLSDRLDIVCELEYAMGLRKIDLVIDNGRPNSFVEKTSVPHIHIFWQNPHPNCELNFIRAL